MVLFIRIIATATSSCIIFEGMCFYAICR